LVVGGNSLTILLMGMKRGEINVKKLGQKYHSLCTFDRRGGTEGVMKATV